MKNLLIFLLVLFLVGLLIFFMLQQSGVFDDLLNGGNNTGTEDVVFEEAINEDMGTEGATNATNNSGENDSGGMAGDDNQSGSEGVIVNDSTEEEGIASDSSTQVNYNIDAEGLPNTALISDEIDRLLLGLAVLFGGFVLIRSNIIGKLFFPESTGYISIDLFNGNSESLSKLEKIKKNTEEKVN